jgi:excisionase family DNA binding protein
MPRSPNKSCDGLHVPSSSESVNDRSEWLDLRALQRYACVSERTLRVWIHRPGDPLPAVRVGTKILIRRSIFDAWLQAHQIKRIDVDIILDEMISSLRAKSK